MDFSKLWIGDKVFVISLNRNGFWEGIAKDGLAKIKVDGKYLMVKLDDLLEEQVENEIELFDFEKLETTKLSDPGNEIDLHIDQLNPDIANSDPRHILLYQIRRCKEFIQKAIELNKDQVLIIHGIGEGALKSEVLALISGIKEVKFTFEKNNGGATEVWFQY